MLEFGTTTKKAGAIQPPSNFASYLKKNNTDKKRMTPIEIFFFLTSYIQGYNREFVLVACLAIGALVDQLSSDGSR